MATGVLFYHGVFALIFACLNISGNLLIIIAFIKVKPLRVNPSNVLILALSIADLLYGSFVLILDAIPYAFMDVYPYGEYGCMMLVAGSNCYVVGNLILVAISIDRLLLVSMDYNKYIKFQTLSRMKQILAICCAIGLASAVFELSLWNYAKSTNPVAANINFSVACFSPARFTRWFGLTYSIGLFCMPVLLVTVVSGVFFYRLHQKLKKTRKIGSRTDTSSTKSTAATLVHNETLNTAGDRSQQHVENADIFREEISPQNARLESISEHVNNNTKKCNLGGSTTQEPIRSAAAALQAGTDSKSTVNTKVTNKPQSSMDTTRSRYIKPAITLGVLIASFSISVLPYCTYIIVGIVCPACTSITALYTVLTIVQLNPLLDPIFYSATQRLIRDYYVKKIRNISKCCTRR